MSLISQLNSDPIFYLPEKYWKCVLSILKYEIMLSLLLGMSSEAIDMRKIL